MSLLKQISERSRPSFIYQRLENSERESAENLALRTQLCVSGIKNANIFKLS